VFVLLDSNVWLAALARDGVCRRVLELSAAFCTPVVTPFVCAEVREKLVTRFHRTQEQADELVSKLILVSLLRDDVAEISSPLRDPDDIPSCQPQLRTTATFLLQAMMTCWN
jgi:predicted nucleic acid-binding protein